MSITIIFYMKYQNLKELSNKRISLKCLFFFFCFSVGNVKRKRRSLLKIISTKTVFNNWLNHNTEHLHIVSKSIIWPQLLAILTYSLPHIQIYKWEINISKELPIQISSENCLAVKYCEKPVKSHIMTTNAYKYT